MLFDDGVIDGSAEAFVEDLDAEEFGTGGGAVFVGAGDGDVEGQDLVGIPGLGQFFEALDFGDGDVIDVVDDDFFFDIVTSCGIYLYNYIFLRAPPSRKEVSPIAKTTASVTGGYHRMSIVIPPALHQAFKAAASVRGESMSAVLVQFIEQYVSKNLPAEWSKKGGRK